MNRDQKIEILKDVLAGNIEPEVALYMVKQLHNTGNIKVFYAYDDESLDDETVMRSQQIEKGLHDKIPVKYQGLFPSVVLHELADGLGDT
jgi:hypothetical protein